METHPRRHFSALQKKVHSFDVDIACMWPPKFGRKVKTFGQIVAALQFDEIKCGKSGTSYIF